MSKVIRLKQKNFSGFAYLCHVPGAGFTVVQDDMADDINRHVLRFGDSIYDRAAAGVHMADMEARGFSNVELIPTPSEF
jgi:hypothetical protein